MTRPLWISLGLLVAAAAIGSLGSEELDRTTTMMLVNTILVVALYTFSGPSGIFSFGHVGFAAIGAYVVGWLTIPPIQKELFLTGLPDALVHTAWAAVPATLAAGVCGALAAGVIGWPIMRLSGVSASIATFAVLIVIHDVGNNWQTVTGASQGLVGVPRTTTTPVALAWAAVAVGIAYAFQSSGFGLRLKATREDEFASRAIGIGVFAERRIAFALSGFLAGIGGALYAQLLGSFTPAGFFLNLTFLLIAMLVVGGLRSLTGAVVGAIGLSAVQELLRRVEEGISIGPLDVPHRPGLQAVGLALILLGVLVLRPDGVTRGREIGVRR